MPFHSLFQRLHNDRIIWSFKRARFLFFNLLSYIIIISFHFISFLFMSAPVTEQKPVMSSSSGTRHYQKNLLANKKESTIEIPDYIDESFKARNEAYSTAEYIPHKWKLGRDTNEPGFATGMDDLSRVVLDAKSDVKFNKRLTTELGAQYWVTQKNKKLPANKQWKCIVTDLNEDGVPEIVIVDANGDVKYVNGWHLAKSKTLLNATHQAYLDDNYKPWLIPEMRRKGQIGKNDMSLKKWIYDQTEVDKNTAC